MKKIILLSLFLGLVGCKETNTGMDKNLFNTSYDKCVDYLTDSLKSPSSLKIREVSIATNMAKAKDINNVFGELITKNGLIKDSVKTEKARFRDLTIDIEYEAQNSYGASIRGYYQCGYIFRLNNNETSPAPLNTYLYKITNDGENVELGTQIPIADFSGSNLSLSKEINRIVGVKNSQFTESDSKIYKEVEKIIKIKKQEDEAEQLRQKWNDSFSEEDSVEAAVDATLAAVQAAGYENSN
ncbi:hypothetical protein Q5X65_15815 [Acinetobacter baumannii]|nr:hypothetical protein [Acinetobacter baumannii]